MTDELGVALLLPQAEAQGQEHGARGANGQRHAGRVPEAHVAPSEAGDTEEDQDHVLENEHVGPGEEQQLVGDEIGGGSRSERGTPASRPRRGREVDDHLHASGDKPLHRFPYAPERPTGCPRAPRHRLDDPGDPVQVGLGHGRSTRQTEPVLEQGLGDAASDVRHSSKTGCRCMGFQTGRASMSSASSRSRIASGRPAPARVHREAGQPPVAPAVVGLGHEGHPGQLGQPSLVELKLRRRASTRSSRTESCPRPMAASTLERR